MFPVGGVFFECGVEEGRGGLIHHYEWSEIQIESSPMLLNVEYF